MLKILFVSLVLAACGVSGVPKVFLTKEFKVGIEYDRSLPMSSGSDRFRHRNNFEPFFVTIAATAKKGFVLDYLEVKATADIQGEVDFCLIQGRTGSATMVFQLTSNQSDFLSYSYRAYGIREDDYNKIQNVLLIPFPVENSSQSLRATQFLLLLFIFIL